MVACVASYSHLRKKKNFPERFEEEIGNIQTRGKVHYIDISYTPGWVYFNVLLYALMDEFPSFPKQHYWMLRVGLSNGQKKFYKRLLTQGACDCDRLSVFFSFMAIAAPCLFYRAKDEIAAFLNVDMRGEMYHLTRVSCVLGGYHVVLRGFALRLLQVTEHSGHGRFVIFAACVADGGGRRHAGVHAFLGY